MTASLWTVCVCVQDNPLLSLNALSDGLRQRSTQTNTAVERKYFHCSPRLTPVKSCLAVLRLFTQTHTSPVPLHLWLHFNLSACGGVRTLVYVCCELDFLFCTLWETYVYNDLLTQKGDFYCVCVCTQTIPKTTHTLANTTHTHSHNPSHTHLPVDRGLRRWNPAAVTVVRRSSRISTETRAWLLSDPARLSSSGKKNAVRRRRERDRGRQSEGEREGGGDGLVMVPCGNI